LWLYGVATKVLANHRRAPRRREALAGDLATHLARPDVVPPADPSSDAAEVRAAIATLSPEDQVIVTLDAWDGLSSPQVAAVVGMKPSTGWVRLHRARGRLRERLGVASAGGDVPTVASG
jgi:RNA polymerase sigma-70 factor (ECF subfamily)